MRKCIYVRNNPNPKKEKKKKKEKEKEKEKKENPQTLFGWLIFAPADNNNLTISLFLKEAAAKGVEPSYSTVKKKNNKNEE